MVAGTSVKVSSKKLKCKSLGDATKSPSPVKASKPVKKTKEHDIPNKPTSAPSKPAKNASDTTKKSKKAKVVAPLPESSAEEEIEDQDDKNASDDEDGFLHGFSTDEDSSDDEDVIDDEPSAFDVSTLPTIAKDDATVKRKLEKAKKQPTEDRGVLFLGRLPHGFYEDQLKSYFSQFGTVTRLRLSRNKKTGKSKHYGFIEFDSSSVAQIVAETMDNYLLMGHILGCKVIPKDEVHPELWIGANRKWRVVPRQRVSRVEHNKPRTDEEQINAAKRLIKRQNQRKRKLEEVGIKYDFEGVGYKKAKASDS